METRAITANRAKAILAISPTWVTKREKKLPAKAASHLTRAAKAINSFSTAGWHDYHLPACCKTRLSLNIHMETQTAQTTNSKLKEFFVDQLEDLLWAEKKLVKTLPKMQEAATSSELKDAFGNHLTETQNHVSRLEQIFGIIGEEADTTKCPAMAGIVDEGEDIIDDTEEGTAQRDVGLIFAGQKAEHYEIATYGGMVTLAKTLGYNDAADILSETLEEEKKADELLSQIAESNVNYQASTEPAEEKSGLFS